MRNISFALTTQQIQDGTKTVTRRMGWRFLKVGELLQPVRKGMGLKPGEKIERLRAPIRVVNVRSEALCEMLESATYGLQECRLEGFADDPDWGTPEGFVQRFCASHKGCTPYTWIRRIEFEYTEVKR